MSKNTGINFGDKRINSVPAPNPSIGSASAVGEFSASADNLSLAKRISMNHPTIVCRQAFDMDGENIIPKEGKYINYPKTTYDNGIYRLDYSTDDYYQYEKELRKSLNIDVDGQNDLFRRNNKSYNRFKLAMPDRTLEKGFVHIFMTRPDCNAI